MFFNKSHIDPFYIHFCNYHEEAESSKILHSNMSYIFEKKFPLGVHHCSYLDLFPRDKLVYLSPHADDDLEVVDEDTIYIIGSFVDRGISKPVSQWKAID